MWRKIIMPFVSVSVAQKLTKDQFTQIKTELGESISVISGKSEAVTLIKIEDGVTFYKAGEEKTSAAFVEVRLYGKSKFEEKQTYTSSLTETLNKVAGVDKSFVTVNFFEQEVWGGGGKLNQIK